MQKNDPRCPECRWPLHWYAPASMYRCDGCDLFVRPQDAIESTAEPAATTEGNHGSMTTPDPKIKIDVDALHFLNKHLAQIVATLDLQIFWLDTLNDRGELLRQLQRLESFGRELKDAKTEDALASVVATLGQAQEHMDLLLSVLPDIAKVLAEIRQTVTPAEGTEVSPP